MFAVTATHAAGPTWDCRATSDGRGWQCYGDGETVPDTATPTSPPPSADDTAPTPSVAPAPPPEPAPPAAPPTTKAAFAGTVAQTGPSTAHGIAPDAAPVHAATGSAGVVRQTPAATPSPVQQAFDHSDMPDLLAAPTRPPAQSPRPGPRPTADASARAVVDAAPMDAARDVPATPPGAVVAVADGTADPLDDGIDWDACGATPPDRAALAVAAAGDQRGPIEVSADSATLVLTPEQAVFSGGVELTQGTLRMLADELVLDRATGEIDATGGFVLAQPSIRIAGSAAHYQLATGQAQVEQIRYRVPAIRARGDAEQAAFLGGGRSTYRNISYTTCRPGSSDWLLTAESLELDQAEGLGTAEQAKLRFKGVPLLYVPTFTFPIDDRRRSGVLIPAVGYTDNTGADLAVPYYLNLAENYDLTLTPRLMSRRGAMLGGEFRFLTESSRGTLTAEYLPDDRAYEGNHNERGSVDLQTYTRFGERADALLNVGYVSDDDYLKDIGDSLAVTSTSYIERTGELRYHGDSWNLLGRLQGFQTIDDAVPLVDRPYSRLPQLRLDLARPDGIAGTTWHLDAEYVNFHKRDSVRGHRIDLSPAVSLPLQRTWGYVEPMVGARYTAYRLTDQTAGLDDAPSHLTGLFSLDSGLYFDRPMQYFGREASQTLEPRLFYLYVPSSAQNDQPVFDTTALDFSFDNLFRTNRYTGPDRVADANQLTLALSSRVYAADSGAELLRASIGQIVYFDDRAVRLPGEPVFDDDTSAVVGELAAQLGGGWRARAGMQWNPHDGGNTEQALAQINYRDDHQRVFNAAYRLRDGVTEQSDLALIWPVGERVNLIGRHNWSLSDDRLLEALAGVEYASCCWRLRALLRQYTDGVGNDHNLAFFVQLELNGLGRLGNDIDQTLERGIYGYRTDDND